MRRCGSSAARRSHALVDGFAPASLSSVGARSISAAGAVTVVAGARAPRQLHEQRDLQGLAIQQDPVLVLAVIPQPLAVIGEEDDDRAVVDAASVFRSAMKLADDRVGGARSRRRTDRRSGSERLRRRVRRVRLVEVEEEEERLRRCCAIQRRAPPRAWPCRSADARWPRPPSRRESRRRRNRTPSPSPVSARSTYAETAAPVA